MLQLNQQLDQPVSRITTEHIKINNSFVFIYLKIIMDTSYSYLFLSFIKLVYNEYTRQLNIQQLFFSLYFTCLQQLIIFFRIISRFDSRNKNVINLKKCEYIERFFDKNIAVVNSPKRLQMRLVLPFNSSKQNEILDLKTISQSAFFVFILLQVNPIGLHGKPRYQTCLRN